MMEGTGDQEQGAENPALNNTLFNSFAQTPRGEEGGVDVWWKPFRISSGFTLLET